MNKVYFFVPNLIGAPRWANFRNASPLPCPSPHRALTPSPLGYARIIAGIAAFVFWEWPHAFFALYFTSAILDAVDGMAARLLNQGTNALGHPILVSPRSLCRALSPRPVFPIHPFPRSPISASVVLRLFNGCISLGIWRCIGHDHGSVRLHLPSQPH